MDGITLSGSFKLIDGDVNFPRRLPSAQITQAAKGFMHGIQTIGDVHEALDMGNVTDCGAYLFLNNGAYMIEVGWDETGTFKSLIEVPAGQWAIGPSLSQNALYAKCADSTGADLEYLIAQK